MTDESAPVHPVEPVATEVSAPPAAATDHAFRTNPDRPPLQPDTAARVGFHELTPEERDLVVAVRESGELLRELLERVRKSGADPRWCAIADTHLQQGLMAAVRSITKPAFY